MTKIDADIGKKKVLITMAAVVILVVAGLIVGRLAFDKEEDASVRTVAASDIIIPDVIKGVECPNGQVVTYYATEIGYGDGNYGELSGSPDCGGIPRCKVGEIPYYEPYGMTADQMYHLICPGDEWRPDPNVALKPVIYLYPSETQSVSVKLNYDGNIFASYPNYSGGWHVTAYPDGKIVSNGKEYSYLFWEGEPSSERKYDLTTGFVIKGSETREFLQEKLAEIGLTPKEYNEFIVYWYPKMQDNAYNLIHFATYDEYDKYAELDIAPKPDSVLRVFMVYKSVVQPVDVEPQFFPEFSRDGFTVVEWGGSEL